jgi:PKD repeat protein
MRRQATALTISIVLAAAAATHSQQAIIQPGDITVESELECVLPSSAVPRSALIVPKELDEPCFDCVQDLVLYRSFYGYEYELRRYFGKHVVLLLPDTWDHGIGFTAFERRTILDNADILYEYLSQIVGGEPFGDEHLEIAFVDECHAFARAWAGVKGIEFEDQVENMDAFRDSHTRGVTDLTLVDAMAINFDLYREHLHYGSDWTYAWTAFLGPYFYHYSGTTRLGLPADELLRAAVDHGFMPYVWDYSANWEFCVIDGQCGYRQKGKTVWAGFTNLVALLHGPEAVLGSMAFLAELGSEGKASSYARDQEDHHVEALAFGAQVNLGCYADILRWQASEELRSRMTAAYGSEAPFCADADSDGFTILEGDCNDSSRDVRPREIETVDGVDEDCDGAVDDLEINEPVLGDFDSPLPVEVPSHIRGQVLKDNIDTFEIEVDAGVTLRFQLCPHGDNSVSMRLMNNGVIQCDGSRWSGNGCKVWTYEFVQAGTWYIDVYPTTFSCRYSLLVHETNPIQEPFWSQIEIESLGEGSYLLTAVTRTQGTIAAATDQVRFWISGFGFIASLPWQPVVNYVWRPGINLGDGVYSVRAQLFRGDMPSSEMSDREYLGRPKADFTWSLVGPLTMNGQSVLLEDRSQWSPDAWTWSIEDSNISGSTSTLHTFNNRGQHEVTLEVANTFGTASHTRQITVPDGSRTVLHVTAMIYKKSHLFVRGNTAWWYYFGDGLGGLPPGSWSREPVPTVINGSEWRPSWPVNAHACHCESDVYDGVSPPLAMLDATFVKISESGSGHHVTLFQSPSEENDYTLALEFSPPLNKYGLVDVKVTIDWQQPQPRRGRPVDH